MTKRHGVSHQFALILNLAEAAKDHKANCERACNVSIWLLREAALELVREIDGSEAIDAHRVIAEMPIA